MFEAVRDINLTTSYKVNFTQNKAVIFTEKAAAYGFRDFIDFIDRDQELLLRPFIMVYTGDVQRLIQVKLKEEEYVGLFLYDLIDNQKAASRGIEMRMDKFLNRRLIGKNVVVVTHISFKKNQPEDKLEISGGAIIKDDKLVGFLSKNEGQGYNFIQNNVRMGTLEIPNPQHNDKYITLEILNSRTKTSINYKDNVIHLKKVINIKTSIGEVQNSGIFTQEMLKEVDKKSESNIKKYTMEVFEKYKNQNIDIFDIDEELRSKYPKLKIEDPIKITELEIEVNEKIEGSSDVTDFK